MAPNLIRAARRMGLRGVLLAAVAVGSALVALVAYEEHALAGLERMTINARYRVRGSRPPGHGVVIVALDDRSLHDLNVRAPVPRAVYARILDRVRAGGPKLLAVDAQFIGKSDPRDDNALLAAFARDGPVLLAAPDPKTSKPFLPAGSSAARGVVLGSVGVFPDPDNILRQMLYAPVHLKTLPVRAAELLLHRPVPQSDFPGNEAWIDFHGPPGTFPAYSFADVLSGRVPASAFAGKTVLVGVTAPVVKDVFVTAASQKPMSGVEVQANSLVTVLDGVPLRSASDFANILLLFALAALPAAVTLRYPALYMLAATVGALVVLVIGVQVAFDSGRIVAVLYPILALLLSAAASVGVESLVERRERQALERAFGPRLLQPRDPPAFFISYRRDESGLAAKFLRDELMAKFGRSKVFMDRTSVGPGQEFPKEIEQAIRACTVMLVLIGPHWLGRDEQGRRRIDDPADWVRLEVEGGLRSDNVVVPVLLEGAKMPDVQSLPESIRPICDRNAVELSSERFEADVDDLVTSIDRGLIRDLVAESGRPEHDLLVDLS